MKNNIVDKRKVAIYSRKSKFTGKGESIANQIEICKAKIKLVFPDCVENEIIIYEDEGFSGGNTNRPQFKKMMQDIKSNKLKAVISYRLDRISRNVADFANMYEEFRHMNVSYISATESYDTSTPSGVAMMSMATVFAQLERETIAERIRDNMYELAKTGRWLGGITPTGYKSAETIERITIDGKQRKAYMLELVDEEAETVELIYKLFLETNSLTKVETYLIQNQILSRNGKYFSRFTIKLILNNPVYLIADEDAYNYFRAQDIEIYSDRDKFDGKHGIMAYNKTIQTVGKAVQVRDMSEWIVAIGKHTGLVSGKDWIKVQELLLQNRSKAYRKSKSNVALLSGLLYCGDCGSFMRPKLTKRLNADGEHIYTYLCEMKEKSRMHNCKMKNPNGNILDRAVCEEIKKLAEDESEFIKCLEKAKKEFIGNNDELTKQIVKLEEKKNDAGNEIRSLVDTLAKNNGNVAVEYVMQRIEELHEIKTKLEEQIKVLNTQLNSHTLSDKEFDTLKEQLRSFANTFEFMGIEEKRAAMRVFIRKIVWNGKEVHLYLFGSKEYDTQKIELPDFEPDCKNSK